jgi:hypothetical protein
LRYPSENTTNTLQYIGVESTLQRPGTGIVWEKLSLYYTLPTVGRYAASFLRGKEKEEMLVMVMYSNNGRLGWDWSGGRRGGVAVFMARKSASWEQEVLLLGGILSARLLCTMYFYCGRWIGKQTR